MSWIGRMKLALVTVLVVFGLVAAPATKAQEKKPNIVFIMGDDIGWMQPSIYHQGLMVGETPNIDRIGYEGAKFLTYYAEQRCTAGRNAFFTGMHCPRPTASRNIGAGSITSTPCRASVFPTSTKPPRSKASFRRA